MAFLLCSLPRRVRRFVSLSVLWMAVSLAPARAGADYQRSIKPLLKQRCFSCHGALKQKGGLRLDTVELMRKGGESGPALLPGDPARSLILEKVSETDEAELMPPKHEGERFNAAQLAQLREWISSGAPGIAGEKAEPSPR